MTTIPQLTQIVQEILGPVAHRAGRESGFVQRKSKLGGAELAQTLVLGWLANPQASYEELAQTAAAVGVTITAQGLEQRLGSPAAACLLQVLSKAVTQMVHAQPIPTGLLGRFQGVYLLDSSVISLPNELADTWRGCGGGHAPGEGSAALKIQVQWELLTGRLSAMELQAGRTADRKSTGLLADLPAGAVALADMGFFSLDRMERQTEQGSYWITRVPAGIRLITADGQSVAISAWLATQGAATQVDAMVHLGAAHKLPCRLLAVRVSRAVADERRRKLHVEARRRGEPVSRERLALADWTVYVTNMPIEQLSLEEAWVLMRVRWQIELLFKLWKSHGQIDEWRSGKCWRILCEVYAKLLGQLAQHWIILASCWGCPDRSLVKAAQTIRKHAFHIASAFGDRHQLERTLTIIQRCLAQVGRLNKRRSAPSTAQRLSAFDGAPCLG